MFGAIDIGGTKTLLATFDDSGNLINSIKFKTPDSYKDFLKQLENSYISLGSPNLKFMCTACPGRLNRNKGIGIAFGNLSWVNVPIRDDQEKLFKCPVIIENDAKLAGLYEAVQFGKKYKKVFYLTVSTGIGGALIINGKIDTNFRDIEPGQILLEHDGELQRWEHFASGKAITQKYNKQVSEITDENLWKDIAHNIAIGLIEVIAICNPDVVIIGGGVGAHLEKFIDILNSDLRVYQNPLIIIPPVKQAKNAEEAVIYGCYLNSRIYYDKASN